MKCHFVDEDAQWNLTGSVSNGARLPGCGLELDPNQMVVLGLIPKTQWYPLGSGTCRNRIAVALYRSHNFGSN